MQGGGWKPWEGAPATPYQAHVLTQQLCILRLLRMLNASDEQGTGFSKVVLNLGMHPNDLVGTEADLGLVRTEAAGPHLQFLLQ